VREKEDERETETDPEFVLEILDDNVDEPDIFGEDVTEFDREPRLEALGERDVRADDVEEGVTATVLLAEAEFDEEILTRGDALWGEIVPDTDTEGDGDVFIDAEVVLDAVGDTVFESDTALDFEMLDVGVDEPDNLVDDVTVFDRETRLDTLGERDARADDVEEGVTETVLLAEVDFDDDTLTRGVALFGVTVPDTDIEGDDEVFVVAVIVLDAVIVFDTEVDPVFVWDNDGDAVTDREAMGDAEALMLRDALVEADGDLDDSGEAVDVREKRADAE
jgi:hypothetical protein